MHSIEQTVENESSDETRDAKKAKMNEVPRSLLPRPTRRSRIEAFNALRKSSDTPLKKLLDEKEKKIMQGISNEQKRTRKQHKTASAKKDKEQLEENKASPVLINRALFRPTATMDARRQTRGSQTEGNAADNQRPIMRLPLPSKRSRLEEYAVVEKRILEERQKKIKGSDETRDAKKAKTNEVPKWNLPLPTRRSRLEATAAVVKTIKTPLTIWLDEKEKKIMQGVSNEHKTTREHNSLPDEHKTASAKKDKGQLDGNKASSLLLGTTIGFFVGYFCPR